MIYSCFDDKTGSYLYFEDNLKVAINADLPVPRLPPPSGQIGVASIVAGRPLPASAKLVGRGWFAKGMLVRCDSTAGLGEALGDVNDWVKDGGWKWLVAGAAALIIWRQI